MSDSTLNTIQTEPYFRLDDLPYELQYEVIKFAGNDGWGRVTLLEIACVNSHYNEIAKKLMNEYEFDNLNDFHGYSFQNFIKVMTSDTDRAASMRRLALTINWYEYAYYFDESDHSVGLSAADYFGIWSMQAMTGLKELLVVYPRELLFLGCGLPPNLRTLIVRPEGLPGYKFKKESRNPVELAGSVHGFFLATALRSKSLKKLDLGGQEVVSEDIISMTEGHPIKESPIEHLKLSVGTFSDEALVNLLQAPRGLRILEFTPPTFEDVSYQDTKRPWQPGFDPEKLPRTSTFGTALAVQADTLEKLVLRRGDTYWAPTLDLIGSLAHFRVLKHLEIDCTMLLGWHHCSHNRPFDENRATRPSALPTLLPPTIETLEIRFEDYHTGSSKGACYILGVLRKLMAASRTNLPKLRIVTFDIWDTLHYCIVCEPDESPTNEWNTWRTGLSVQWVRFLHLYAKDAPFEFKLRGEQFWVEEPVEDTSMSELVRGLEGVVLEGADDDVSDTWSVVAVASTDGTEEWH